MSHSQRSGNIHIIGGGPAGFGAAEALIEKGVRPTIVEAGSHPGGMAGSTDLGANRYDFGTHIFHTDDPQLEATLHRVVGDALIPIGREIRIKWGNAYLRYPLQIGDIVAKMPPWTTVLAGLSFLRAQLFRRQVRSAEDALINGYGERLYRMFFHDYSRHFWGCPPSELSPILVTNRIPRLDAFALVKAVGRAIGMASVSTAATDVEEVRGNIYYHARGGGGIYEAWQASLESRGATFLFNHRASGFVREGKHVTQMICETPAGPRRQDVDGIVSTMPLPLLHSYLDGPRLPEPSLQFRSLLVFGILVRAENLIPAYFVYYHNTIFGRLAEPKNTGLQVTPPDATVLLVEVACDYGDQRWEHPETLCERIIDDLEQASVLRREQILEWHVLKNRYAYPLFMVGFEEPLEIARRHIASVPNVVTAGRQGEFRYVNQHIAIKSGAAAAVQLLKTLSA